MQGLLLITPPTVEPVSVAAMKIQLGMGTVTDSTLVRTLDAQLAGYITAARHYCESYTRSVFITQTWILKLDGLPWRSAAYLHAGRPELFLPKPPFQSIASFQYVDTTGALQQLAQDTTYGNGALPQYSFQLDPGSETQPARVAPSWLVPWPPTRSVQSAVLIQFKCGFGGPVVASMSAGSAILSGPVFLPGDVGQRITVPGAGAAGVALVSTVASVDQNGQAALADAAVTAVSNVSGYAGRPVPPPIVQAVLFMAQFFYEQGSIIDLPTPRIIMALLDPYRNLVA